MKSRTLLASGLALAGLTLALGCDQRTVAFHDPRGPRAPISTCVRASG